MLIELSRGSIAQPGVDGGEGGENIALAAPVNDLMGLREETAYLAHLAAVYPRSLFEPYPIETGDNDSSEARLDAAMLAFAQLARTLQRLVGEWIEDGIPQLFLRAAKLAETGHFSAELARLFEAIHRNPGDEPDNVADLLELATWSLDQTLRHQPILVRNCALCRTPWITSDDTDTYCSRPAPGRLMSCRFIKKDERFRESNREWRREYQKIYDRKRRGTITEAEWKLWKSMNGPELWTPYDNWKAFGDTIRSTLDPGHETEDPESS